MLLLYYHPQSSPNKKCNCAQGSQKDINGPMEPFIVEVWVRWWCLAGSITSVFAKKAHSKSKNSSARTLESSRSDSLKQMDISGMEIPLARNVDTVPISRTQNHLNPFRAVFYHSQ